MFKVFHNYSFINYEIRDNIIKSRQEPYIDYRFIFEPTIRVAACSHFKKLKDLLESNINVPERELSLYAVSSRAERLAFEVEYGVKLKNREAFSLKKCPYAKEWTIKFLSFIELYEV